jgi:hypothetical protein
MRKYDENGHVNVNIHYAVLSMWFYSDFQGILWVFYICSTVVVTIVDVWQLHENDENMMILAGFYTTTNTAWAYHAHYTCIKIMDFW